MKEIKELNEVAHLHFSWACEKNMDDDNIRWGWTPEDPSLYYFNPKEDKDIDVCFLGTIHHQERMEYIEFLKHNLKTQFKTYLGGGQRQESLSSEKYAEITRRSKIIVNFPGSMSGFIQLKRKSF